MSKVFVLDSNKQPCEPVHPGWARVLLTRGKAAVFRRYPFTIILQEGVTTPKIQGLRLKIDPGSKTTGLAILDDTSGEVVWSAELTHRAEAIKRALEKRRGYAGRGGTARRATASRASQTEPGEEGGCRPQL